MNGIGAPQRRRNDTPVALAGIDWASYSPGGDAWWGTPDPRSGARAVTAP